MSSSSAGAATLACRWGSCWRERVATWHSSTPTKAVSRPCAWAGCRSSSTAPSPFCVKRSTGRCTSSMRWTLWTSRSTSSSRSERRSTSTSAHATNRSSISRPCWRRISDGDTRLSSAALSSPAPRASWAATSHHSTQRSASPIARNESRRDMRSPSSTRLPQIVSGLTDDAVEGALRLFGVLTDRLLTVEVEEAELAKLFLNSWRYFQFAIANQFFMIAEDRDCGLLPDPSSDDRWLRPSLRLPTAGPHRRTVSPERHDAALGFRALAVPSRTRGDGGQRGPCRIHRRPALHRTRSPHEDRRDSRDGVQARDRRHARLTRVQAEEAAHVLGRALSLRTRSPRTRASSPWNNSLRRATSSCSGLRRRVSGASISQPEKVVIDVWGFFGDRVPVPAEL